MSGHIFNIQDDGTLVEMNEERFENEDIFQTLLEQYPNLLAGDQINSSEPRRWLLVKREMGVPSQELGSDRWSLDHLFLDQEAIPTLVEVKRSTDTRIRREVVGQMLDYAANAVAHWSIEQVMAEFEKQCERDGADPDKRLEEFLRKDLAAEDFWRLVKTNLQAGKVRLLFVADVIPAELRRIVEFLNAQMDPAEVLAVEIKHYVGPGLKTLVPRIIGQTAEAESRKGTSTGRRNPPLTEQELQQIANDRGVGPIYSELAQQLKTLFNNNISTSRSNITFKGKIQKVNSPAVIAALSPVNSTGDQGLLFDMYTDRLAEVFNLDKQRVVELLPPTKIAEDNPDYAGEIRRGFVKSASDLAPVLSAMKQAKESNMQSDG